MIQAHIVNLCSHDVNVMMANEDAYFTIAPSGVVARCQTEYNTVAQVTCGGDTFNIRERYFGEVFNLPDEEDGVLYIVSRIVAEACADVRNDLLIIDTPVREGKVIVGCEAFGRWPTPPALYDCGCINHGDDENVGCESCGHQSCLDCHHVNATSSNVSEWICYEGYGCNKGGKKFDCITCGYNNEDENFLIEKTGEIVCDNCMTVEQHNLWACQNYAYNPDSYVCAPCSPELECGHFVPCDECQGDITVGDEPCYACAYAGGKKAGDEQ
jgi:hypothetical protein